MRRAPAMAAAAVTAVLGMGLLAGCQTGQDTEPADQASTPSDETTEPAPTDDPTAASTPEPGTPVNGPNSITSPAGGDEVTGPTVTVTGEGTGFEGTLAYRVTAAGETASVSEGFTTAGANGEVGPYTFDVDLEPGEYTVQVWEPGMGEGDSQDEPQNLVEVTFTVS